MNYLINHDLNGNHVKDALQTWSKGADILTPSFFFWGLGNHLQKSLKGFLQSMLYQLVDSHGQNFFSTGCNAINHSFDPIMVREWTERTLLIELNQYLLRRPTSSCLCFFIDGLDEMTGDRDTLLDVIRLLERAPLVKVCVSSRPEPFFERVFRSSPRIRLQDFNREDMEQTVKDKLKPVLEEFLPQEKHHFEDLMRSIVNGAEGVFLWLNLVIKDIVTGVRNHDTIEVLRTQLRRLPDTIDGLYTHMLSRLDQIYRDEATIYFGLLMLDSFKMECTLLHLVFADTQNGAWDRVLAKDYAYFDSESFHELCKKTEKRLLTVCGGLVEVSERHTMISIVVLYGGGDHEIFQIDGGLGSHYRDVRFIHKTVPDFLGKETYLQSSKMKGITRLSAMRCRLGVYSLLPNLGITKEKSIPEPIFHPDFILPLAHAAHDLEEVESLEAFARVSGDAASQLLARMESILQDTHSRLNMMDDPWNRGRVPGSRTEEGLPFHDFIGFMALWGFHYYVSRQLSSQRYPPETLDYLLVCAATGLDPGAWRIGSRFIQSLRCVDTLLEHGADPNAVLQLPFRCRFHSPSSQPYDLHCVREMSPWTTFVLHYVNSTVTSRRIEPSFAHPEGCMATWRCFISHGADLNAAVFSIFALESLDSILFVLEESPLSFSERLICGDSRSQHRSDGFCEFLRSQGSASEYRRCRCRYVYSSRKTYQVPMSLSDRLFEGFGPNDLFCTPFRDGAIEELIESLTEADIVDPSTLTLRASRTLKQDGKSGTSWWYTWLPTLLMLVCVGAFRMVVIMMVRSPSIQAPEVGIR